MLGCAGVPTADGLDAAPVCQPAAWLAHGHWLAGRAAYGLGLVRRGLPGFGAGAGDLPAAFFAGIGGFL